MQLSRENKATPHLALIAVQVFFATWPIAGKVALAQIPVTLLAFLRITGAALLLWMVTRIMKFRAAQNTEPPLKITAADNRKLFLLSLLGVSLNQLFFITGLKLTTAINATLLTVTIPIFTLAAGVILGSDRLNIVKILGIAVAACGVIYLVDPMRADFSAQHLQGNLFLVGNTFVYGLYLALSKATFACYGALRALSRIFIFSALTLLPLGIYHWLNFNFASVGGRVWLAAAYIVVFPTVGAYLLNAWALARVSPSVVAIYVYLQPLIAFIAAPRMLNEKLSVRMLTAGLLICLGVLLVTRRRAKLPNSSNEIHLSAEA